MLLWEANMRMLQANDGESVLQANGCNSHADKYNSFTPLHWAAFRDDLDSSTVEFLVSRGADVNVRSPGSRWTPLHLAVGRGQLEKARVLLERGADVNATSGEDSMTPLHLCRDVASIRLLLEHGARPNARDRFGNTPGESMRGSFRYQPGSLTQLLEHGLDVNERGENRRSIVTGAMDYATRGDRNSRSRRLFDRYAIELLQHVKRLNVLGARVSRENRRQYAKFQGSSGKPFAEMRARLAALGFDERAYHAKCARELAALRAVPIKRGRGACSLADVLLLESARLLYGVSDNVNFRSVAEAADLDARFPVYAFLIRLQFKRASALRKLYETCENSLEVIAKGRTNVFCAKQILTYLSEGDLENLNEAVMASC